MEKLAEFFKRKDVLLGLGILVAIVVIIYVIKRLLGSDYLEAQKAGIKTSELSYQEADYLAMASQLKAALGAMNTDEEAIFRVLNRMKTKSDYLKLKLVFGIYEDPHFYSSFKGNLDEWLISELDEDEQLEAQRILNRVNIVI